MRVVVTGLSHKTATVQLRETLSFYGQSHEEVLHGLRDAGGLTECALLSTCNRTEIYALTEEEDWQEQLLEFLARHAGVLPGQLQSHLYAHEGTPAVRHLFRVASGLDSMVMGEGQILAQVREMLNTAQQAGTTGSVLHTLCQRALETGKRARTETEIGRGAVSVSLAAVQLARRIFQRLDGRQILLLGAGETGEQTAKVLVQDGAETRMLVCNRTHDRAVALAERFGGTAIPFERLNEALARADIVISSTGAPKPIVTQAQVRQAMRARRGKPVLLVDIAVPRDVEPGVEALDDVYLYNIDDLQAVVAESLAGRQVEATRVEELVEEEVGKFQVWMRSLEVAPTIRQLQALATGIVDSEFARVGGRLSHLSQRDRDVVETLLRGVVNKLQRPVILHLKDAAGTGNGYHEVEQVRAMFGLDRTEEWTASGAPVAEAEIVVEGVHRPALCDAPEPIARGGR